MSATSYANVVTARAEMSTMSRHIPLNRVTLSVAIAPQTGSLGSLPEDSEARDNHLLV